MAGSVPPEPATTKDAEGGRSSGRAAMVTLILLVLVISYASSLRAWLQQRDELTGARAELEQTHEQIEDLEQTTMRWKDPAFIEQQARLRLGWVLPGEVGYRVIGADGEPLGDTVLAPDSLVEEPAAEDWYASVWGSIEAAGQDGEADDVQSEQIPDPEEILRPSRGQSGDAQ